MPVKHLALFFRDFPGKGGTLYYVRAVVNTNDIQCAATEIAEMICRTDRRFNLEYIGFGQTELAVDEEYFRSGFSSKKIVFLQNCQAQMFDEAFGGNTDVSDEETLINLFYRTLRIGEFLYGQYHQMEPTVIERVAVN